MEDFHGLLILMVVVWVMGKIFRMLTLPVVFGELMGGLIVGPLALNIVDPGSISIKVLAELGIFFLMLHAGLETDPKTLFKAYKKAILIAGLGVIIPMSAGFFISQYLGYEFYESLFIGVIISVTSIAISVRILKDCRIRNSDLADTVLGAAILSDIIILIIFSTVINLAETGDIDIISMVKFILKLVLFFILVIYAGFKLGKYTSKYFKDKGFTFTLIIALALGYLAEWIGLHVVIGAFLAGLFIREELLESRIYKKIEDRIYGLSYGFLGPIFFTTVAFNLDIKGVINSPKIFIILFLTAYLGKFISTAGAALIQKIKPEKSFFIGLTMNSRGALDLVLITIGLKYRIIDQEIFSMLVSMAFLATMLTVLILRLYKKAITQT